MLEIIAKRPEVGDGATVFYWTDSEAYTIIDISESGKVITIQRDKATINEDWKPNAVSGGFVAHVTNNRSQSYTYERDTNGKILKASLRKNGSYYLVGSTSGRSGTRVATGFRTEFYDYNF